MPIDFISMVPLQLANTINNETEILSRIKTILVGGGSLSDQLEKELERNKIVVWNSFGMSETYSHIALRKAGYQKEIKYTTLADVEISTNADGQLQIKANWLSDQYIQTNDLVEIIDKHHFIWKGRSDFRINTGGIKLSIEEIEQKIEPIVPPPYFIWKELHDSLGEQVVLVSIEKIKIEKAMFLQYLSRYEMPKKFYTCKQITHSSSGKIMRELSFETAEKESYEALF